MRSALLVTMAVGAVVVSSAYAAQTSSTPRTTQPSPTAQAERADRDDVTIVGCLEKNKSGGFWLTKATRSSRDANTTASPSDERRSASPADANGMNYNLEDGKDLDQHVGHRMEVTGRLDDTKSSDRLARTTGDRDMEAQDFHVESQRMVANTCS